MKHLASLFKIFGPALLSFFVLQTSAALAQTVPTAPNSGAGDNNSYNWAGYVANSGPYTQVTGSWIVPQVPAANNFSGDAAWVGIGGVQSQDLIQLGTEANVDGSGASYQAWYEMLPQGSHPVDMQINAGDSMTASIAQQSNGQWLISLIDNTNGQSFQKIVNYNSSQSSAEWIEEMSSQGNGQFIPIDNFGSIQFSNASATTANGASVNLSQSGASPITMVNFAHQPLATVSSINPDGASFSIARTSNSPDSRPQVSYGGGGSRGWSRAGRGGQGFTIIPMPTSSISGFPFSMRTSGFSRFGNRRGFTFSFRNF